MTDKKTVLDSFENDAKEREFYEQHGKEQIETVKCLITCAMHNSLSDRWFYEFYKALDNDKMPKDLMKILWKTCRN